MATGVPAIGEPGQGTAEAGEAGQDTTRAPLGLSKTSGDRRIVPQAGLCGARPGFAATGDVGDTRAPVATEEAAAHRLPLGLNRTALGDRSSGLLVVTTRGDVCTNFAGDSTVGSAIVETTAGDSRSSVVSGEGACRRLLDEIGVSLGGDAASPLGTSAPGGTNG
mmetsp:Transcript_902/g.2072  ORF Transcript_902/g.2072 Transcript_902/m.2072 type:complete len:165 (-) Transcript_902:641-1135(-)